MRPFYFLSHGPSGTLGVQNRHWVSDVLNTEVHEPLVKHMYDT
jgi:hypothetical protein